MLLTELIRFLFFYIYKEKDFSHTHSFLLHVADYSSHGYTNHTIYNQTERGRSNPISPSRDINSYYY